jgi:hypothetical protein
VRAKSRNHHESLNDSIDLTRSRARAGECSGVMALQKAGAIFQIRKWRSKSITQRRIDRPRAHR